jgi:hypothetical protein
VAIQTQSSDVIDMINTIDSKIKRVHTQSLDISFNELLDMYQLNFCKVRHRQGLP